MRRLLLLPALLTAAAVLIPLGWLVVRAAGAEGAWAFLTRPRSIELLENTALLALGVLVASTLVAAPLAWLVTRTDVWGRRLITALAVLPLAVPGYVMAYSLRGLGGPRGAGKSLIGLEFPLFEGYWGALVALTLYNAPYLFLTLKVALERLDSGPTEAARSLGAGPVRVLFRVVLPSLLPAWLAGALLIGLYVLGDFGVVSLMRYPTLSLALYSHWAEVAYAAWIALVLLALAAVLLVAEGLLLGRRSRRRVGVGTARVPRRRVLGWQQAPAWIFSGSLAFFGLGVPVATAAWWWSRGPELFRPAELWAAAGDSLSAALPGAFLTVLLALPLAFLADRSRGLLARAAEAVARVGYAVPPLALALALVFFSLAVAPGLRDTRILLVVGFALHGLMLALGPLRGTLALLTPRHEEAARSLGAGPLATLARVTLPALKGALGAGFILAFLAAMKELPLTRLLAPLDFRALSVVAWGHANEAMFADAAPYALAIVGLSAVTVALVLRSER
jgi:iron(III) transport system permease protein